MQETTVGSRQNRRHVLGPLAKRNTRGSAFVELTVAGIIMVSIVLFALDLCLAMVAYSINDRACRDAARAAANGSTAVEADGLARTALKTYANLGLINQPALLGAIEYQDYGGVPQPGKTPYVTVTTRSTVNVPVPTLLLNNAQGSMSLSKRYTFPIVKLKPPPPPSP